MADEDREMDEGPVRPGSKSGSRPTSAASKKGSRPPSAAGSKESVKGGSRPGSAALQKSPSSQVGSRPASAHKQGSRPASAARNDGEDLAVSGSRPGSARKSEERPASNTSARPTSGRASKEDKPSSRPVSAARSAAGSRPGSANKPTTGSRPASASRSPQADRPPSRERPTSGSRQVSGSQHGSDNQQDQTNGYGLHEDDNAGALVPQMTTLIGEDGEEEEEDYEEEEDGEETEDDSEGEENEMVVLDPDHPLMKRFQSALKAHLDKQDEKLSLRLQELTEGNRNKKKNREDLGIELYGVQQELARHQMLLEQNHDQFSEMKQTNGTAQSNLSEARHFYRNLQANAAAERKKGSELQAEVENLALRLFYMENAKEDARSDISVMKRAAQKADTEVAKAEVAKQKQDLFVDRLVERVDKLREEIAMYEAQTMAQREETKATKDALSEAHMEMEAINLEKKQLFQQWNSSLIGMKRRDEAHSAMMEALTQQNQRIKSLETEIDGFKRYIQQEQEQNEKLTLVYNKTETDITTVRKLLQQIQEKHEALKNEYATYTRMLQETEQALSRATTDKTLRQNEVTALRKQIEKEYLERIKLEDEILEKIRSQLTVDKAAKYTNRLVGKTRSATKDLESQVANVENVISKDTLEASNTRTRVDRLQKVMLRLDQEISEKNEIIDKSEAEIAKQNAVIERKQGQVDQYNKKLEQMIASSGGVELGPLEIQINSLNKSVDAKQQEISELQQMWLRDQSELVRLCKEKDTQSQDVENLKKQLTILTQKKLRIENEINRQKNEIGDKERSIKHMQNDMLKLNMLLHKERGAEHNLQQSNILMENDFMGGLKEAEKESIQMQADLEANKEEKERLLNSLIEAERQIMLWEKKIQLAKETRAAVDSDVGQGEIQAMKAEIHRMSVRYAQLMKQQERMIQEMEKAVSRRDTIVTRGDAQSKTNKSVVTKGAFQRQMTDLRKKIKHTVQDASSCDDEIRELREAQSDISGQLEERQLTVHQLQTSTDTFDGDIERLLEQKQKNMMDLLSRQQKNKYYQQLKDGKYTRLCKSDTALEAELEKQTERVHTLAMIVDRLNQEFPHVQPTLRKVALALNSRISGED